MISRRNAIRILELDGTNPSLDDIKLNYQELALQWHPSKHRANKPTIQKFEELSRSYLVLTEGRESMDTILSPAKMCEVFIKAFDLEDWYNANPLECSSSDACNDNVGQGRDTGCQTSNSAVAASQTSPARNNKGKSTAAVQTLPVENSNVCKTTNHNEGATAPGSHTGALPKKPQTPKKLSKKAAKKQRRKQRQKQQDAGHEDKDDDKKGSGSSSDLEDEKPEVEEEDLDLNSAFVVMSLARKAAKASGAVPKKSVKVREDAVAQSRKLAEEGFELCHLSRYKDAISMFSQAIKLCPDDHTSYGNRSFCYCILERYDKALYDAEKAVSLQPTLAKGYFRRGKAQLGLQKYREAAESFKTVLNIDPECHEAFTELHNVHIYELMGMGFTQEQADWALTMGGEDIQSAVDALCGNGNYKADTKMNPGNLDGLCSIWVGNVRPEVTEKMLRNLFHKYGDIQSMRLLRDKFCAFINYGNKLSPSKAMEALQGYELCGSNLLIRFPDNPVTDKNGQFTVLRKSSFRVGEQHQLPQPKIKMTGPVNGKECYFWRTFGCVYGSRCFYEHIPEHEGIDKNFGGKPK